MALIGSFKKMEDGYAEIIRTMTINCEASDFKVIAGDKSVLVWNRQSSK